MKKIIVLFIAVVLMIATVSPAFAAGGGFNQFGYNYGARIFVGPADGVDKVLDGMVWGDPFYANDHLVMKWNAAWDACNAAGGDSVSACLGAWTTNEWNGRTADGSDWMEHYKIIWVGSGGTNSPYWRDGGYLVWGNYEVIMDQALDPSNAHVWYALATPNGLGH